MDYDSGGQRKSKNDKKAKARYSKYKKGGHDRTRENKKFWFLLINNFKVIYYFSLASKTEIISVTNEESNPKALINNPVISKTFNLRRVIVK